MSRTTQRTPSARPPCGTLGGVCQNSPAFTWCSTPSWTRVHSPSRHTPHCSLGCAWSGETAPGSSVTTDSIAVHAGEHSRADAGRQLPLDAARLQTMEARCVAHSSRLRLVRLSLDARIQFALPRVMCAITLSPSIAPAVTPPNRAGRHGPVDAEESRHAVSGL